MNHVLMNEANYSISSWIFLFLWKGKNISQELWNIIQNSNSLVCINDLVLN